MGAAGAARLTRAEWRRDLKAALRHGGVDGKPIVLLASCEMLPSDGSALNDLQLLIGSGRHASLYSADELGQLEKSATTAAKRAREGGSSDSILRFFWSRACRNVHLMLCVSEPAGRTDCAAVIARGRPMVSDGQRQTGGLDATLALCPALRSCCDVHWIDRWDQTSRRAVALAELAVSGLVLSQEVMEELASAAVALDEDAAAHLGELEACGEIEAALLPNDLSFLNMLRETPAIAMVQRATVMDRSHALSSGLDRLLQAGQAELDLRVEKEDLEQTEKDLTIEVRVQQAGLNELRSRDRRPVDSDESASMRSGASGPGGKSPKATRPMAGEPEEEDDDDLSDDDGPSEAVRVSQIEALEERLRNLKAPVEAARNRHRLAKTLVDAFGNKKHEWSEAVKEAQDRFDKLLGDALLSAALVSYLSRIPATLRSAALDRWKEILAQRSIAFSGLGLVVHSVLATPAQLRGWVTHGLADEPHELECMAIIMRSTNQPVLLLDPDGHVSEWLERAMVLELGAPARESQPTDAYDRTELERLASEPGVLMLRRVEEMQGETLPAAWSALLTRRQPGWHPKFRLILSARCETLPLPQSQLRNVLVVHCGATPAATERRYFLGLLEAQRSRREMQLLACLAERDAVYAAQDIAESKLLELLASSKPDCYSDAYVQIAGSPRIPARLTHEGGHTSHRYAVDKICKSAHGVADHVAKLAEADRQLEEMHGGYGPWLTLAKRCAGFYRIFEALPSIAPSAHFGREWFDEVFKKTASGSLGWKKLSAAVRRRSTTSGPGGRRLSMRSKAKQLFENQAAAATQMWMLQAGVLPASSLAEEEDDSAAAEAGVQEGSEGEEEEDEEEGESEEEGEEDDAEGEETEDEKDVEESEEAADADSEGEGDGPSKAGAAKASPPPEQDAEAWDRVLLFAQSFATALFRGVCPALNEAQRRSWGAMLALELQMLAPACRDDPGVAAAIQAQASFLVGGGERPGSPESARSGANSPVLLRSPSREAGSPHSARHSPMLSSALSPRSPAPHLPEWVDARVWAELGTLEASFPAFQGLRAHMVGRSAPEWGNWLGSDTPETSRLPGVWMALPAGMPILLLLRCCRPDRLRVALDSWTTQRVGTYLKPSLEEALAKASKEQPPTVPILLLLGRSTNPLPALRGLATRKFGKPAPELMMPDDPKAFAAAEAAVREAVDMGRWVLLHNVHLAPRAWGRLTSLVRGVSPERVHADFQLWITAEPSPPLPSALLNRAYKLALEPPRGLVPELAAAQSLAAAQGRRGVAMPVGASLFHSVVSSAQSCPEARVPDFDGTLGEPELGQLFRLLASAPAGERADVILGAVSDVVYGPALAVPADVRALAKLASRLIRPAGEALPKGMLSAESGALGAAPPGEPLSLNSAIATLSGMADDASTLAAALGESVDVFRRSAGREVLENLRLARRLIVQPLGTSSSAGRDRAAAKADDRAVLQTVISSSETRENR